MLSDSGQRPYSPVRILVLSWGPSIHAWRRIRIFMNDPGFSVTVASTYDFGFERATNVLLNDARRNRQGGFTPGGTDIGRDCRKGKTLFFENVKNILTRFTLVMLLYDFMKSITDAVILWKAVRKCRPQIIFLQTLIYPCFLAFLLPKSIPIVITFWNGDVTWWSKSNGIERVFKKKLVTYGVRRAKALTVNSNAARDACLGYGASGNKIHLIRYPGVEREWFKPSSKAEAKIALNIGAGKVILCPRGIGGYLNSDVIVESAVDVVKKIPDVLFVFVSGAGSGEVLKQHQDRVKQLGIDRNFRWNGQVLWELMPVYYNASDLMVSISSNDSLPNCMMEALACGTPVIMGDIPQIREWIEDGRNGFLVPPRDPRELSRKIVEVLELPPDRIGRITERGRERAARDFDSSINIVSIKNLVRRIAGNDSEETRGAMPQEGEEGIPRS
jgi:glycosyltransferase involved in cell wall biosynthesis